MTRPEIGNDFCDVATASKYERGFHRGRRKIFLPKALAAN
jgi:hypothetical protein